MSDIKSHILKLTGKSELPEPVEIGHNYKVTLEGSVTSVTESDNEDGTNNRLYTFKPVHIELMNDKGTSLKLKDTRSKSQLLRGRFWKQWQNNPDELPFEVWYDRLMGNLIQHAPEIVEMYWK